MKCASLILLGALALLRITPACAADTVYYYSSDTLHSEVVVTDQNRNVVERTYYAPYGAVLNRDLRDGPGYTGHEEDPETGLVYMQQRYYDPEAGRFLSTDPVLPTSDGGSFNRYEYAEDDPYRYTDPTGMASKLAEKKVKEIIQSCTGSHTHCPSETRSIQVGSPSVSEAKQATAQQSTAVQSIESAAATAAHWVRNRSSATAEAAAAFGPGVEGQATKQLGSAPDSTSANFVVGEGAYVGATGNFQVFRWGQETSAGIAGKLIVDPTSYVRIKLGAGLSLGVSVDLYPHGGAVSVSVGGGFGEQAIVKPPATPSLEKNW